MQQRSSWPCCSNRRRKGAEISQYLCTCRVALSRADVFIALFFSFERLHLCVKPALKASFNVFSPNFWIWGIIDIWTWFRNYIDLKVHILLGSPGAIDWFTLPGRRNIKNHTNNCKHAVENKSYFHTLLEICTYTESRKIRARCRYPNMAELEPKQNKLFPFRLTLHRA